MDYLALLECEKQFNGLRRYHAFHVFAETFEGAWTELETLLQGEITILADDRVIRPGSICAVIEGPNDIFYNLGAEARCEKFPSMGVPFQTGDYQALYLREGAEAVWTRDNGRGLYAGSMVIVGFTELSEEKFNPPEPKPQKFHGY